MWRINWCFILGSVNLWLTGKTTLLPCSIVDLLVIVYGIYKKIYINLLCPKLDLNINNGNQIEIDTRV
jgi:hypothetical protein